MLLLLLVVLLFHYPHLGHSLNQEGLYLQQLKLNFDDPDAVFSNWNDRDDNPCNWYGVFCDSSTHSVTSIDLSSTNIAGPFPSLLCRLQNLTSISLFNNSISSTLPENLTDCKSLQHLNLAQNLLTGTLPSSIADLPELKHLDLTGNNFSGQIPATFGNFQRITESCREEDLFSFMEVSPGISICLHSWLGIRLPAAVATTVSVFRFTTEPTTFPGLAAAAPATVGGTWRGNLVLGIPEILSTCGFSTSLMQHLVEQQFHHFHSAPQEDSLSTLAKFLKYGVNTAVDGCMIMKGLHIQLSSLVIRYVEAKCCFGGGRYCFDPCWSG